MVHECVLSVACAVNSDMESIMFSLYDVFIERPAAWLAEFAACEWNRPMYGDRWWTLSAHEHIKECYFWVLFVTLLHIYRVKYHPNNDLNDEKRVPSYTVNRLMSWCLRAMGVVCVVLLLVQLALKYTRGPVHMVYLFMPCHLFTAALAYVLLETNTRRASQALSLLAYFPWAPAIVFLTQDHTEFSFWLEPFFQTVQHYAIVIFFIFALLVIPIQSMTLPSYLLAVEIGFTVITLVHTCLSWCSCLNVNYAMVPFPIPKFMLDLLGVHYRVTASLPLTVLALVSRLIPDGVRAMMCGKKTDKKSS